MKIIILCVEFGEGKRKRKKMPTLKKLSIEFYMAHVTYISDSTALAEVDLEVHKSI